MNTKREIRKKRLVTFVAPRVWEAIQEAAPFGTSESEIVRIFLNDAVKSRKK